MIEQEEQFKVFILILALIIICKFAQKTGKELKVIILTEATIEENIVNKIVKLMVLNQIMTVEIIMKFKN